ncbi:MAG: hypothetical protein EOP00_36610, partial [Pedobacter sp.]
MKKYLFIFGVLLSFINLANAQNAIAGKLVLKSDFSSLPQQPLKDIIKSYDLARLSGKTDTAIVKNSIFNYEKELSEPLNLTLDFYWKDKIITSNKFWIIPGRYDISFNSDLTPKIVG